MEIITLPIIKDAMLKIIKEMEEQQVYFNDLDAPIGDSDHGDSIVSTFSLVQKSIGNFDLAEGNIGSFLNAIGRAIIMGGGASMGPLYGTAFMDAGKSAGDKKELNGQEFTSLWEAFVEGIRRRGNVKPGEKTMYDTIFPAVQVLSSEMEKGTSLKDAIPLLIKAAEDGMNSTRDMLSIRGRSSRLGERSRGHIDPGAASMNCLIRNFFTVGGESL
jgi:dihydroxyacetone kinase-like protein